MAVMAPPSLAQPSLPSQLQVGVEVGQGEVVQGEEELEELEQEEAPGWPPGQ